MKDLEETCKNNSDLINCLDADDWVKLMREIAISSLQFPKDKEIEAIRNAKNITIRYSEIGIANIEMYTSEFPYEDYKIELNILGINVGKQKGHSHYENLFRLPISTIRILLKSKLCN